MSGILIIFNIKKNSYLKNRADHVHQLFDLAVP